MADTNDIYQRAFDLYGQSPKSLHWVDYPSQAIRFKHLVEGLRLDDKSILDAGCGMGDLLPFLYAKADNFHYLGVDINEDFVNVARKKYGGHNFKVGDPFTHRIRPGFDVVLSSGVMNQNIPGWLDERKKMIRGLFANAKQTVAFNMAGSFRPLRSDSLIAYADARQILDYCLSLTDKVDINTGYLPHDFTVIMHK